MRRLGSFVLGLAFASGVTAAQAQTIISRQITTEPVETVVTQGPNGTVVTRRPLGAAPAAPAATVYAPPAVVAPAYPPDTTGSSVVETVETVEQPTATVTREIVRPRAAASRTERTRTQSRAVRTASKNAKVSQRVVTRQLNAPLSLSPDERRVVYRTIVRERVVPAASVVTREIVTPPAPRVIPTYPPVTAISTDGSAVVEAADTYVGATLPRDVVFYDVPSSVALSVPATRPYRYAYVDDRVLLVDPVTRMVVEDVTP